MKDEIKKRIEEAVRAAVNYIALNIDAADSEQNREVLKRARVIGNLAGFQENTAPHTID